MFSSGRHPKTLVCGRTTGCPERTFFQERNTVKLFLGTLGFQFTSYVLVRNLIYSGNYQNGYRFRWDNKYAHT
jgi:hypothetical protein